jgi:NitT/TauT family transport system substrate-binding protein
MRRRTRVLGLLAASVFAASCTGGGNGSAEGSPDDPYPVQLTVSTWPLLAYTPPVLVALEQGYYQEEGLEVDPEVFGSEGGGTTVRNILNGDLEFGLVSTSAVIQANLAGAPLIVIAPAEQQIPEFLLYTREDSGIDSLEEALEAGVQIGYTNPGSATQSALAVTVERLGYDWDDVNSVATGGMGAGIELVKSGGLDVASVSEPVYTNQQEGLKVIFQHSETIPAITQTVWVTSPQLIRDQPEVVRGFLKANIKATDWIEENPDAAAELWAQTAEIPVESTLATFELINSGASSFSDYYADGFDLEAMEEVVGGMRVIGLLEDDDEVRWTDIVNQDFLPEDVERVDFPEVSTS